MDKILGVLRNIVTVLEKIIFIIWSVVRFVLIVVGVIFMSCNAFLYGSLVAVFLFPNPNYMVAVGLMFMGLFLVSWFLFKRHRLFRAAIMYTSVSIFLFYVFYTFMISINNVYEVAPFYQLMHRAWEFRTTGNIMVFTPILCFVIAFLYARSRRCPSCSFVYGLNCERVVKEDFLGSNTQFGGYNNETRTDYFMHRRGWVARETTTKTPRHYTVSKYRQHCCCVRCGCTWTQVEERTHR